MPIAKVLIYSYLAVIWSMGTRLTRRIFVCSSRPGSRRLLDFAATGLYILPWAITKRWSMFSMTVRIMVFPWASGPTGGISLIGVVTLAAFIGTFTGKRLMKKITLRTVQLIVGIGLLVLSIGLITGLI